MARFSGGVILKPSATIRFSPALGYWRIVAREVTGRAMAEELNATARKGRTEIRRKLAQQTLMSYGEVSKYVSLQAAHSGRLVATIRVRGKVPTLAKFMTSFTKPPKSWRKKGWRQTMRLKVWEGGKKFPYSGTKRPFVFRAKNGTNLIGVRTGTGKLPVKVLSGPHLPNETLRPGRATGVYVRGALPADFNKRVLGRISRILGAGK